MPIRTRILTLSARNLTRVADRTASLLLRGEVCVIPTDTIYGIVALDELSSSVERVYEIKGRPKDKPFIRLIGRESALTRYTDQPLPPSLGLCWPGPLTIVFRKRGGGTVAIRRPDDPFLNALFERLGERAIVAPSANLSGEEEIRDCRRLAEVFSGIVSLVVCAAGGLSDRKASSIVDISEGRWRLVRQGELRIDLGGSHDSGGSPTSDGVG